MHGIIKNLTVQIPTEANYREFLKYTEHRYLSNKNILGHISFARFVQIDENGFFYNLYEDEEHLNKKYISFEEWKLMVTLGITNG